ncbi:MAG: phosphatidate cytidylyltransferase [Kordiimonadaceae bacterium]|jgi:phosphatidate cytidylyltransferase|nr:phosphatidate cytidylyltransferase [Kordiimonadaceae bacterium]
MAQGPKKNQLLIRVLSALVMLPVAIYIIMIGGLPLFILISLLSVIILSEWNGICEKKPFSLLFIVQSICTVLLLLQLKMGSQYMEYAFVSSIVSIIAVAYLVNAKIVWAILGFLYTFIPSYSVLLIQENFGSLVLLWMMLLIWGMDTGAYFVGKKIGGPKMSPKISPNKTWSGLIGGTITAMILAYVFYMFAEVQNITIFENALILLILSGSLAILSQIGDLTESAVKRRYSVKDSGSIIPGHGGVMDRVDGILFVAPAILFIASFM